MTVGELRAGEKVRDTLATLAIFAQKIDSLRRPGEGLEPTYPTRAPATLPASQPEQQSMANVANDWQ